MGTKKITGRLKVHTSNPKGDKVTDECVISAHGLKLGYSFDVPNNVIVVFYTDDNFFLKDPTIEEAMFGRMIPVEAYAKHLDKSSPYHDVLKKGKCPNYVLGKYQGYHGKKLFGWTAKLKNSLRRGEEPSDWETYSRILNTFKRSEEEITKRKKPVQVIETGAQINWKKLRKAWTDLYEKLLELKKNEVAKDIFFNDHEINESYLDIAYKKLGAYKKRCDNSGVENLVKQCLKSIVLIQSSAKTKEEYSKKLKEISDNPPMDCVTIRYRPANILSTGGIYLNTVIKDLKKNKYDYSVIHCSFCRGRIKDAINNFIYIGSRSAKAKIDKKKWKPNRK